MRALLRLQKVRFILVGGFNTSLDFAVLNGLVFIIGLVPIAANTISVSVGITVSYFLNHFLVFRSKEKVSFKKYIIFFGITGFSSLVLQNVIIYGFELFTNSHFGHSILFIGNIAGHQALVLNIAKATAVLIGMVWNFMLYKHVLFKESTTEDQDNSSDNDSILETELD